MSEHESRESGSAQDPRRRLGKTKYGGRTDRELAIRVAAQRMPCRTPPALWANAFLGYSKSLPQTFICDRSRRKWLHLPVDDRRPTVGQRNLVCESDAHALRVEAVVLTRSPRNRRTKMTTWVCVVIRSKHGASEFEP